MFFLHLSKNLPCTALPREKVTVNNPPSQAGSLTTYVYRINGEKYRITSHLKHIILDAPPILKRAFQGEKRMSVTKE